MSNSSSWTIDWTLSGATTSSQSGLGNDGDEGVICIPQSSSITGASSSGRLVSCPGHSLEWGFYPSAEMQSVYSTFQSDLACIKKHLNLQFICIYTVLRYQNRNIAQEETHLLQSSLRGSSTVILDVKFLSFEK